MDEMLKPYIYMLPIEVAFLQDQQELFNLSLIHIQMCIRDRAKTMLPLDLHVLSLQLAFILSQDQTLHCNNIFSNCSVDNLLKDFKSININIDGSCFFRTPYIYITYGAPACTTCLFILNLSKNSHLYFTIVSESGCKGKRFYRNHQMFSKVFFEKVFFPKLP